MTYPSATFCKPIYTASLLHLSCTPRCGSANQPIYLVSLGDACVQSLQPISLLCGTVLPTATRRYLFFKRCNHALVPHLSTTPHEDRSLIRGRPSVAESENKEGGGWLSSRILEGGGPTPRLHLDQTTLGASGSPGSHWSHFSTDLCLIRISVGPPGSLRW